MWLPRRWLDIAFYSATVPGNHEGSELCINHIYVHILCSSTSIVFHHINPFVDAFRHSNDFLLWYSEKGRATKETTHIPDPVAFLI
jgi:hypothetical protein